MQMDPDELPSESLAEIFISDQKASLLSDLNQATLTSVLTTDDGEEEEEEEDINNVCLLLFSFWLARGNSCGKITVFGVNFGKYYKL